MELVIDRVTRLLTDQGASKPPQKSAGELAQLATASASAARGLVANLLHQPNEFDGAASAIEPGDLADAYSRDVFILAKEVYLLSPGAMIDLAALAKRLIRTGRWDVPTVGRDLVALMDEGGAGCDVAYYVRAVRTTKLLRDLYVSGGEMQRMVLDVQSDDLDTSDLIGIAGSALDAVTFDRAVNDPVPLVAAVSEGIEDLDRRLRPNARRVVLGFADLDRLVPQLDPGNMIVIAARPSVGKTALGLAVGMNVARRGETVLFASLEMSRVEIGQRAAFFTTGASGRRLRSGSPTDDDVEAMANAVQVSKGVPLWVDDTSGTKVPQIAAAARRIKRRHGLGLILVDYLQIVAPDDRRQQRREQVEQVSRDLKRMARELGVPVVALAQLNRESENRTDGRPRLSDLREAGGIEQDADVVLLLWRKPDQADDAPVHQIGCEVAKQRNGPTGEITLAYRRSCMRFENMAPIGM